MLLRTFMLCYVIEYFYVMLSCTFKPSKFPLKNKKPSLGEIKASKKIVISTAINQFSCRYMYVCIYVTVHCS